jgi:predicted dehydrogenase
MSIGVGVIGCGSAASRLHLPVLQRLPGVRVTAIASDTPASLSALGDRYAVRARYRDYHDLLRDPAVDAVVVCVPPALHEPVGLAALDAKKHVLMEKPLALSLGQCATLVRAAESAPVTTMVGFHLRWHALVLETREWIVGGRLGSLELLRTVFTSGIRRRTDLPAWRTRRQSGGGVLIESGVHYYDLWRFLTSSEVDEIHAATRCAEHDDVTASVMARLRGGALATAEFCQGTVDSLEIDIYGSAGRARMSGYALGGIRWHRSGCKGLKVVWSRARSVPGELLHAVRAVPRGGYYADAYRQQWMAFLGAIGSGRSVGASFADGREATRVALAATQSATARRAVRIADCADAITPVEKTRAVGDAG